MAGTSDKTRAAYDAAAAKVAEKAADVEQTEAFLQQIIKQASLNSYLLCYSC